jgi:hypothetical protein
MKQFIFYCAIAVLIFASCKKDETSQPQLKVEKDTLTMGPGYANDIYYSLKNGIVAIRARNEWDLAFSTAARSSSILINGGNGIELHTWKDGALSDFNSASTLNFKDTLNNNDMDTTWFNSAFEQNALGYPDYGWGKYNDNTHDVNGDSVYILKLSDGSYKKIAILNRRRTDHSFNFIIADLSAGAKIDTVSIPTNPYTSKNFIYYSIANKQLIDREPANGSWDFVMTKYLTKRINYKVTGLLTAEGIASAVLENADTTKTCNQVIYSKAIDNIGFNWKTFDGSAYTVNQSVLYDLKTPEGQYYQLRFISFDMNTGTTIFEKKWLK